MSGIFSGIMVDMHEKGCAIEMADVRIEFNEAFEMLNAEAASLDSFYSALERLSMLNDCIQKNDGRADKGVIAFLNQNNGLAEALGISIDMENFNDVIIGAEVSVACEGVLGNAWEAIKNFFKNIWDGIVNFVKNLGNMFKSTEAKFNNVAATATNNPGTEANVSSYPATATAQKGIFKIEGGNGVIVVKFDALIKKYEQIVNVGSSIAKAIKGKSGKELYEAAKGNTLELDKVAGDLGLKRVSDNEYQLPDAIFTQGDLTQPAKTLGEALTQAGYVDGLASKAKELAGRAANLGRMAESFKSDFQVFEKFASMSTDALIKEFGIENPSVAEKSDAGKVGMKIGKMALLANKCVGLMAKALQAIATDLEAASSKQAAENKAADEKAKAEQAAKAAQAAQNNGQPATK